jgi:hypothetical protein
MCSVAKTVVRRLSRLSGVLIGKLIALQVARESSVRDGSTTGVPARVVMMIEGEALFVQMRMNKHGELVPWATEDEDGTTKIHTMIITWMLMDYSRRG